MPAGHPPQPLHLSLEEAEQLKRLARLPRSAQALALRARIALASPLRLRNTQVPNKLHVNKPSEEHTM